MINSRFTQYMSLYTHRPFGSGGVFLSAISRSEEVSMVSGVTVIGRLKFIPKKNRKGLKV